MAAENEYREKDQNVTENVNVSEADNQPEYVNVEENVAEADNLAMVRYVPQNDENVAEADNLAMLTGLPEILPTRIEVKEDY
ncbi:hypothetical protein QYF36_000536 [Acer negundo]|nr:hypothetical protein QYF36_014437 [Acer negundo]KAK4859161.1 hypothetical protein QYF36_000536 [Acer negundo]